MLHDCINYVKQWKLVASMGLFVGKSSHDNVGKVLSETDVLFCDRRQLENCIFVWEILQALKPRDKCLKRFC